jgi:hypothetical protein
VGFVNLFGIAEEDEAEASPADFGPDPFLIQTFTQPKMEFSTDSFINNWTAEQTILVKNYQWADGSIVFIDTDDKNLNATAKLYKWVKSLGYEPEQSAENISKFFTNLADQKMQLRLSKIDASGKIYETWNLLNVVPTNINFGDDLDYTSDTITQVALDFAYTTAKYEKGIGVS